MFINEMKRLISSFRHQKREAEPKDNDLNKLPVRNMHISTYKQVATDGEVCHKHTFVF